MVDIPRIGILDSGIGGMSVLRALYTQCTANYIYYADTKNAPYGTKTLDLLEKYAIVGVEYLLSQKVDSIVLACNTISGKLAVKLQQTYSIPFYTMLDHGYTTLLESNRNLKNVVLFATQATLLDGSYKQFLLKHFKIVTYQEHSLPALVTWAERGIFTTQEVGIYIKSACAGISQETFVILGCTHYPLFEEVFMQYLPKEAILYNPAFSVAASVAQQFNCSTKKQGYVQIYATGEKSHICTLCKTYGISI